MAERTDLNICRELINPHFDGYKLSLESLPTYSTKINQGIEEIALSDEQYSYHHAKLFGGHNHLVLDQWSPTDVYFIDKDWNVMKATAISNSISVGEKVLQIPDSVNQKENPLRVSLCLHFVSPDLAVITDGAGKLHLVSTGNRTDPTSKWKILFSSDVLDDNKPLVLTDAVLHSNNENHFVECLCTHVIESTPEQREKHRSSFLTIIEWVTLTSVDKTTWTVGRTRQLFGRKPFDYAAVDREGLHLIVAAEALFDFVSDTLKPVIEVEEAENGDSAQNGPEYTWNQTHTMIHAQFTVPPSVTKADVSLATGYDKIDLGLKNGKTLIEGQLFGRIDPNEWDVNLSGQRLELTLTKETEGMWPEIVVGNNKGEMTMDEELVKQIHDRLEHLTSDQWNPDPQAGLDKPYNAQQLEECDAFPEESAMLHRINGDTHKLTHQTNLGSHQWLFKASLDYNKVQSICLRHDVDGLVWQPENVVKEKELPWKHVSTFNAFGYVQASKQQRKYTTCAPDCSYAVICDCVRHVYIYRQPSTISSPIRNRKTGQQVDTVAKQQVIALESVDNIIGLQATNDRLFITTKQVLYSVLVNSTSV